MLVRDRLCAALGALLLGIVPAAGQSAPPELVLAGQAVTGTDRRAVRVHFACTANAGAAATGVLAAELEVADVRQLAGRFDFDPFEGPSADAGARSHLEATTAAGVARGDFSASGYTPAEPETSFILGVNAALRRDGARLASLARVLRPLAAGPGTLVWRQAGATAGGTAIVATFDVPAADAVRLKALIGPCLAVAR